MSNPRYRSPSQSVNPRRHRRSLTFAGRALLVLGWLGSPNGIATIMAIVGAIMAIVNVLPYVPIADSVLAYMGAGRSARDYAWLAGVVLWAFLQTSESVWCLPFLRAQNLDRLYKKANRTRFERPNESDDGPTVRIKLYRKQRRRLERQLQYLALWALVAYCFDFGFVVTQYPWVQGTQVIWANVPLTGFAVFGLQLLMGMAAILRELVPDVFGDGVHLSGAKIIDAEVVDDTNT